MKRSFILTDHEYHMDSFAPGLEDDGCTLQQGVRNGMSLVPGEEGLLVEKRVCPVFRACRGKDRWAIHCNRLFSIHDLNGCPAIDEVRTCDITSLDAVLRDKE